MLRSVAIVSLFLGLAACASATVEADPVLARAGIAPCRVPDIAPPATVPKPAGTALVLPRAPAYPYPLGPADRAALEAYATCLSDGLPLFPLRY